MVGVVAQNAAGTVELFAEQQPGQGMRQGQARQPDELAGLRFEAGIDTVGATDDESGVSTDTQPALQALGKPAGRQIVASLVEHDHPWVAGQRRQHTGFFSRQQLLSVL